MSILLILANTIDNIPEVGREICSQNYEFWIKLGTNLGISILGSAIAVYLVAWLANLKKSLRKLEKASEKTTENFIELTKNIKKEGGLNYANQKEAECQIIKDIQKSKTLRVYAMCASSFSDKQNSEIAKVAQEDTELIQQYLISDLDNEKIAYRQKELSKGFGDLRTKIQNSLNSLIAAYRINKNITIRLHKERVGFRLIILDNCIYISHQTIGKSGKETEIRRVNSLTPEYVNYLNYFERLWENYENSEIKTDNVLSC